MLKEKRGRGRPPKAPEDKASEQIAFRLTPVERKALTKLCRLKESVHGLCRRLALEASGLDQ